MSLVGRNDEVRGPIGRLLDRLEAWRRARQWQAFLQSVTSCEVCLEPLKPGTGTRCPGCYSHNPLSVSQ